MEYEIKEFVLEGQEFLGIKAGQDYYKSIKNDLITGINKIIFPENCELLASWIRGFMGQRDEDLYIMFSCATPEIEEFAKKFQKEFEHIRGDKDAIEFKDKKKKKK